MKTKINKWYFLIPVLYVGVIFLLVLFQFTGREVVSEVVGELAFSGTIRPGAELGSREIAEVRVEFRGISFFFDAEEPVVIRSADGSTHEASLITYESQENGFDVVFEHDVILRYTLHPGETDELHINAIVSSDAVAEAGSSLVIPFRFSAGASLHDSEVTDALPVRYDGQNYFMTLPPRGVIDPVGRLITLSGNLASQTIRYTQAPDDSVNVATVWFSDNALAIPDAVFDASVARYIDAAYNGWRTRRYNGGTGTWTVRDGSPRFSEAILTAYLAEAWHRNEYTAAFNEMRRAADLHRDSISLLSSPFLGNLREVTQRQIELDRVEAERLQRMIDARDPAVFAVDDIVGFAADRGGERLYDSLIAFASALDFRGLDFASVLDLLRAAHLDRHVPADAKATLARVRPIIDERVIPALVRTDEKFFVQIAPGRIDVYYSILAGKVLEAVGLAENSSRYVTIGRNVITSALSLANEDGYLPATLFTRGGELRGSEGAFGPERVYTLLSRNPAYPRRISLRDEVGPGTWMHTIAEVTNVSISATAHRFTLRYPRNRTHYIVMAGVRPFADMQLFRQLWRDDPLFESYVKGRHYDASTQTLMIKYTDDSVQADIVLLYR